VAQVVQPDARNAEPLDLPVELTAELVRLIRTPVGAGEHEVVVVVGGAQRELVLQLVAAVSLQGSSDLSVVTATRR
jgi:hypothetical protein